MTITPQKLEEQVKSEINLTGIEKQIDEALLKSAREGRIGCSIDADKLFPNIATKNAAIEKYCSAGWNVKYESDQRDGSYLVLTPSYQQPNQKFTERYDLPFGGR